MSFREEVDALHTRFLDGFKTRDAVAGTAGYTEDAVYLASGSEPVRGRTAITTGLANLTSSMILAPGEGVLLARLLPCE